jgi:transcription elongation GreA/GreB family factor
LARARGTDFSNARTDLVSIGTIVKTTNIATGNHETFTVLGAWDSDPDKGVVSYLSPMAQALMNRKIGDEVEFEIHGAKHKHRIEGIEAFKPAATPAPAPTEKATSSQTS